MNELISEAIPEHTVTILGVAGLLFASFTSLFSVVNPLALPLLSGPGSIAVVIGFATQADGVNDYLIHGVAVLLVVLATYIILRLALISARYIGPTGLNVMTRLMGLIALAISVQFILIGISRYYGLTV